jgi:adenine-specific DNA-methyltransferase
MNMMWPRLRLARNLLRQDGVLFISIDEVEVSQLRVMCCEIFGEENVLDNYPVVMNLKGNQDAYGFAETHEYVIACLRSKDECLLNALPVDEEEVAREWLEDEYGLYKEADNLRATGVNAPREKRPNLWYPIFLDVSSMALYVTQDDKPLSASHAIIWPVNPEGEELSWYWSKNTFLENRHNLILKKTANGWQFYRKQRPQLGDLPTKKPKSFFYKPDYSTSTATNKLKDLFGKKVFDGPKPVPFIRDLLIIGSHKDGLVLDFFAGSGTTGEAVYRLNAADGGTRRFILVQLPEPTPEGSEARRAGYASIAGLTKDRLRRAAKKTKDENPMFAGDFGFRVFKLDSSNIRAWEPDRDNLNQTLIDHQEHLKADRTEEDILYELLLKLGLDLCVPIETKTIAGKAVHSIGGGVLLACLATQIAREEVEPLAQGIVAWHKALAPAGDTTCVFRDSAFADDVAKTNLAVILIQNGVSTVRSL